MLFLLVTAGFFTLNTRTPLLRHPAKHLHSRYESILLAEDEAKVTETPETRVPNASLFTLAKEDHTLGNLLRDRLLRDPACATEFAAYQVPHPLFPDVLVRVQTDGSITPREAVIKAARGLIEELEGVRGEFQKEWELVKIRRRTEEAERAAQEGLTASGGMDGVQATDGVYGSVDAYGVGGQQQGQSGGYGGGGQPNGNYGYQGYAGQGQADGYQYGGYGGQQNGGY